MRHWTHSGLFRRRISGFFSSLLGVSTPDGRTAAFDKNWTLLESNITDRELALHVKPESLDEMLQAARGLSVEFDFVRVDLYNVSGRIYFGELTCTPAQGFNPIASKERQRMRDEMWHLDANNRLLYRNLEARQSCAGEWRSLAAGLYANWFRPDR